MHLNISSQQYQVDELSDLIDKSEVKFNVIGITESRLNKEIAPFLNNFNLQNYNIQHTPTESNKGDPLLYISTDLSYKTRNELKMYKSKELESFFIEMIKKGKNTIVGCVYKHRKLTTDEFNNRFLSSILEKV